MSNPRKPLAISLLHGNPGKRPLNRNEPSFKGHPKCPTWLHSLAKAEWKRITSEVAHLDLLKGSDQASLAAYCQSYARWVQAEKQVTAEGQLVREPVVTRSGTVTGYRWKKHPAVAIAKDERAAMIASGRLFGLSPSSRAAIHAPVSDPLASGVDAMDDDELFSVN
jgi:P27 family predicted phage terminase small subunit